MEIKTFKNKISTYVLLFASVALLAAGCGGGGSASTTLVVWTVFEDASDFQPLVKYFNSKRPNIRVQIEQKNPDTYEEDLLNALASGVGPDVFSIHNSWLPKYLDKVSEAPDGLWNFSDYRDSFVDAVVSDFTQNRKIYGAATYVDSLALYYNKDILGTNSIATPPKTWSELESDSRQITRLNFNGYFTRSGVAMGLSSNAPGGRVNRAEDILYLLLLQRGVTPWSADGLTPTFATGQSSRDSLEALNFYTSFANAGAQNYTWNTQSDYSVDAFANSRVAFMINYSYARELIEQKASNLNYGITRVPQVKLDGTEVNFASYWGQVVSRQSKHQQESWEFIKAITSKDALDAYSTAQKLPSSRRDLIELQIQDPEIGVFAHANLTAKSFYRPDQQKIDAIISNMIDDVTLRNVGVSEALSRAASQASEIPKGK